MAALQYKVFSHSQKVCRLYKKALVILRDWYIARTDYRYHAILLRARFDEHKNEKDMRKVKLLVAEGEEECFKKRHPHPMIFAHSPGGVCYDRYTVWPDVLVDEWHPSEKALFPEYFKRREEKKLEYFAYYAEKFGKEVPPPPKEFFEITEDKVEIVDGYYRDKVQIAPGQYKSAIKDSRIEVEGPPKPHI